MAGTDVAKEDQENCDFCNILAGVYPISEIYSDDICVSLMTMGPVNEGHAMVIPRRHAAYLAELTDEEAAHIFLVTKRIAAAIRKTNVRCEGINLFLADGEAAQQEIFHFHLHVYPRFEGDGFGFKYDDRHFQHPQRDELDRLAALIRDEM